MAAIVFGLAGLLTGCNFLDVVPNDTATLEHVFSNRSVAEKFLRTCYSHLPDPTNPNYYPAYYTSRDEFDYGFESRTGNSPAGMISKGLQNTNNPYLNYWSGYRGGNSMFIAIRDCNIFLENIHKPLDLLEEERVRWIAEVKFLKAYYHFFLMQLYGPIVLVRDNISLATDPEELKVYREPIDDCVNYIVELLDETIPDLPLVLPDPATEQGRITAAIAMAVKAKVLAWGASPLFNGNTDYKNWIDNRGRQLIPDSYDVKKWERAAKAIKAAIDTCHAAGMQLYQFNKYAGGPQAFRMNDTLVTEMTIRKAVTEDIDRNTGVIWATQEAFGNKFGAAHTFLGDMIRMLFPILYAQDQSSLVNYHSASWHMSNLFYSNNGLPIDEDKDYDFAGRLNLHRMTRKDGHESYIATGETTINLHLNREPRFYADLGIDRGYYALSTTTKDGGLTFSPFIRMRDNEFKLQNIGYLVKKIVPFEASCSQGDNNKSYTPYDYRFPLLRLADLYLLYSEALNEIKAQPDPEVYHWIDLVRSKAGLPGVVESWKEHGLNPEKPATLIGMRDIIRRERLIELAFEGQRFWDVRRWKIADKYWSLPVTKWNLSKNVEEEYIPVVYGPERNVTFRDYLWPLQDEDLRINPNLVQTYGW